MAARSAWVPERQDIIWIDCNPQIDSEMRDIHPMLVLSPGPFNKKTGLVIGLSARAISRAAASAWII